MLFVTFVIKIVVAVVGSNAYVTQNVFFQVTICTDRMIKRVSDSGQRYGEGKSALFTPSKAFHPH